MLLIRYIFPQYYIEDGFLLFPFLHQYPGESDNYYMVIVFSEYKLFINKIVANNSAAAIKIKDKMAKFSHSCNLNYYNWQHFSLFFYYSSLISLIYEFEILFDLISIICPHNSIYWCKIKTYITFDKLISKNALL